MALVGPQQLVRRRRSAKKAEAVDLQDRDDRHGDDEEGPGIAAGRIGERAAVEVRRADHEEQHREREDEVLARCEQCTTTRAGCGRIGVLATENIHGVGKNDTLVLPDDHPHVGRHQDAEHHADADRHVVADAEERRTGHEVLEVVLDETRDEETRDESGDGRPAEPPQGAARNLVDGDVAGLALVAEGRERGHLYEVEVIEEADPADAGDDVQPTEREVSEVVTGEKFECLHWLCSLDWARVISLRKYQPIAGAGRTARQRGQ